MTALSSIAVTLTVTTDDIEAVRNWLTRHDETVTGQDTEDLIAYVWAQLSSNSDWDGVPIALDEEARS